MSEPRRLNDMTVEELLVAYETETGDERETYAIELDARGVLDGARPQSPVSLYARWRLALGLDCEKVADSSYELLCGERRIQVHGRMEDDPAAVRAPVRFDPEHRTFDTYALVLVGAGYSSADALLCPWDELAALVRAGVAPAEGEITVSELAEASVVDRIRLL